MNGIRMLVLGALIGYLATGAIIFAAQPRAQEAVQVAYLLDRTITGGFYMGDRWVAPAILRTARVKGKSLSVRAMAQPLGAIGGGPSLPADWSVSGAGVTVSEIAGSNTVVLNVSCEAQAVVDVATDRGERAVTVTSICSRGTIQGEFRQ